MAENIDVISTSDINMEQMSQILSDASTSIHDDYGSIPEGTRTPSQSALLDAANPEISVAFLDTLKTQGIDTLTVEVNALSEPETALPEILTAGREALHARGLPDPDVQLYRDAAEIAQTSGQNYFEAVADLQAQEPLAMRKDLIPRDSIEFMDVPETVGVVPPVEGPVAETQYDVHAMGFPIAVKNIGGFDLESSASHGFLVVTERGMDPMIDANVLLATRGGPDHLAGQTMFGSDSSLPEDTPSETEKTYSGNVYISDNDKSFETDVEHDQAFFIKTYEVNHDLETMQEIVQSHRHMINRENIDYELLNQNSNTYYGDITEILTGQEPPDYSFSGGLPRYFPAVNNDLMDYSRTEFADELGLEHEPYSTRSDIIDVNQGFSPEEDYSYGFD